MISDSGLLNESTLNLVRDGIKSHFSKDYVSSLHILVPQIEATLRTLLNAKGIKTIKTKRNVIMDNELGGILNDGKTKALLGENLATYLQVKYTDQRGQNLRNDISHGLLDYRKFTYDESLAAIRILLLLAMLYIQKDQSA